MFGILAVFGDAGAAAGPWLAGAVADATGAADGSRLSDLLLGAAGSGLGAGLLIATVFPLAIVLITVLLAVMSRRRPGLSFDRADQQPT